MRTAARAIIIKDDQFLVMDRDKFGLKFCALIGGGVDAGETVEQALIREISEETSITVKNPRLVIIENAGEIYGIQYIFSCEYVSGEPALAADSPEMSINSLGQNLYRPMWLPLKDLPKANLLPKELKATIIKHLKKGFPVEPIELTILD